MTKSLFGMCFCCNRVSMAKTIDYFHSRLHYYKEDVSTDVRIFIVIINKMGNNKKKAGPIEQIASNTTRAMKSPPGQFGTEQKYHNSSVMKERNYVIGILCNKCGVYPAGERESDRGGRYRSHSHLLFTWTYPECRSVWFIAHSVSLDYLYLIRLLNRYRPTCVQKKKIWLGATCCKYNLNNRLSHKKQRWLL